MLPTNATAETFVSQSHAILNIATNSLVLVPHPEWGWFPETAWAMSDSTIYTKEDLTKLMLGPSLILDDTLPENSNFPLPLVRCLACSETFILRKRSAVRHCNKEVHRRLISMAYGLPETIPPSYEMFVTDDPFAVHQSRERSDEEASKLKETLEYHRHREKEKTKEAREKLRAQFEAERVERSQMDNIAAQVNALSLL
ncbi:hypothetical protein BDY19DRAFT_962077 [Irpex rosettiformis]|uniref:Uncharacterized protein n=1 Tax=Irpex rosettiformis TaxID=378272 RepID=A0ACB8TWC0_9APHY|nr:hypothetical protein BDY19DRAFT_962077 [Irpex rosettiformis]